MSSDWWKPGWREEFTLVTALSPVECRVRLTGLEKPTNVARVAKAHPVTGQVNQATFWMKRKYHAVKAAPHIAGSFREDDGVTSVAVVVARRVEDAVFQIGWLLAALGVAVGMCLTVTSPWIYAVFLLPLLEAGELVRDFSRIREDSSFMQQFLLKTLDARLASRETEA